jgi:flavin reductase (DIM6/NTAB) family NADH-FMN oxidoreductase RutF
MSEATKPIPAPTDNTAPFWSGCAAGELRLRKCAACGVFRSPTRMVCACGATAAEWTAVSGRGTVFSYTVVHRAPDPAFKAELPYVIAIVALDEGGRLMSNLVGTEPPLLMFCPGDRDDGTPQDSARNARDRGDFVVNLVDDPLAEVMVRTSASLPPGESEALRENLTLLPSSTLATPRLAAAPASFECKVHSIQLIGENRIIFGLIQRTHVRDDLYDPETARIRAELYHPIGRMASPNWYCHTRDQFDLVRPA